MTKYEQLEKVLGECFDPALLPAIEEDWNEFYNNPEKYEGTVVVKMVNKYIDDQFLEVICRFLNK